MIYNHFLMIKILLPKNALSSFVNMYINNQFNNFAIYANSLIFVFYYFRPECYVDCSVSVASTYT